MGEKDNLSRKLLSDLKDMATYWGDIPFQDVAEKARRFNDELISFGIEQRGFIFIHCREPQEIQRLLKELPYETHSLLLRRRGLDTFGNHADDEVENF
jgi:hypothetical protein